MGAILLYLRSNGNNRSTWHRRRGDAAVRQLGVLNIRPEKAGYMKSKQAPIENKPASRISKETQRVREEIIA